MLAPRTDFYAASHPLPEDVLLLVEVMETSAGYDGAVKLPLYASAGVREVWLVDLERGAIEQLRNPSGDSYAERRQAYRGDDLTFLAIPGLAVAVEGVLGPP